MPMDASIHACMYMICVNVHKHIIKLPEKELVVEFINHTRYVYMYASIRAGMHMYVSSGMHTQRKYAHACALTYAYAYIVRHLQKCLAAQVGNNHVHKYVCMRL